MNKLFSKIATLSVGLAMAIGVGVALGQRNSVKVEAAKEELACSIIFKDNESASDGTASKSSIEDIISDGASYVSSLSASYVYQAKTGFGIKMGSSKNSGVLNLTLANSAKVKATRIVFNVAPSDTQKTIKLSVNGKTSGTGYLAYTTGSTANEFDDATVEWDGETALSSVKVDTNGQKQRIYLKSISIYVAVTGPITYAVTYNANGGSGEMTDANSPYAENSTVTVLDCTFNPASGYEFESFNTEEDGSGTRYVGGDTFTISGDIILYAQWIRSGTVSLITVSGDMTKTSYNVGESWNPSGLTVMATYTSEVSFDVTEDVEWSFNPEIPTAGVTSVVVTASYGGKSGNSSAQSVTVEEFDGYVKVDSLVDFKIGDSYVIGTESLKILMGGNSTGNYRDSISANNAFTDGNDAVYRDKVPSGVNPAVIVTLLKAEGENTFYIYDITNDKYLRLAPNDSKMYDDSTIEDATPITFSFSEGKLCATIPSGRELGYNSSANPKRFSSYATYNASNLHPVFYRMVGSTVKTALDTFCTNSLKMDQYAGDETYDAERCVANYTAAKTAYQALSDAEVNVFINASEYADAKTRFANWAAANGDNFNDTTGAFVRYNPTNFIGGDTSGYAIIIVIATTSILAFGLAIMLRKKHR